MPGAAEPTIRDGRDETTQMKVKDKQEKKTATIQHDQKPLLIGPTQHPWLAAREARAAASPIGAKREKAPLLGTHSSRSQAPSPLTQQDPPSWTRGPMDPQAIQSCFWLFLFLHFPFLFFKGPIANFFFFKDCEAAASEMIRR